MTANTSAPQFGAPPPAAADSLDASHKKGPAELGTEAKSIAMPDTARTTQIHPSVYIVVWICLSSSVILFNKWILHSLDFGFPIFLTTWHLVFATIATRVLARTTNLLDGLKNVHITRHAFVNAIVPIGVFFSMSLVCSNNAIRYLSVAFVQMLKGITPVAVLLATWMLAIEKPNFKLLLKVSTITFGVMLAAYGELKFSMIGFIFQISAIAFEATRLVMVQKLLSSAEYKMDPLVSLYYFAPVCAFMNFILFLFVEAPKLSMEDINKVGPSILLANAAVAFALNVSVVFLIGKTSSLVLTLSGVLKDISLVCASVVIWSTPISALQLFGYTITIAGLLVYKLGTDKLTEAFSSMRGTCAPTFGRRFSAIQKALLVMLVCFCIFLTAHWLNLQPSGGLKFPSTKPAADVPVH
ncbi:triose-phosphate transporter family-domain-containing protein [Kalaharituber pfeilii]|nr:triose-phosphate transporter family-domain-containing protein [Kalaharituber pfeilii]